MTEQTDAARVLPGTWRNHDDPRDEWPGADDWNPEHVAGILADAVDEFWTALNATYDAGGDTDALGSEYDAMARRVFTGPELAAREAAARAEAWDEGFRAACEDSGIVYDIGLRPPNPHRDAARIARNPQGAS